MVVLILGMIAAALVMAGGQSVLSSGSNETQQGYDMAQDDVSKGSCYNKCRMKYPVSGAEYAECKEDRCS